jgi:hypothetical protein
MDIGAGQATLELSGESGGAGGLRNGVARIDCISILIYGLL